MKTAILKYSLGFAAASLLLANEANATMEVQTQAFPIGSPTAAVPFSTSLTFNGFNSSLGTLNEVDIILTSSATVDVQIENLTGSGIPGTPPSPENVAFSQATAVFPVIATSALAPGGQALSTSVSSQAGPLAGVASPGLNDFPGMTATAAQTTSTTAAAQLADYASTPSFLVTVGASAGTYSGSAAVNQALFFGGSATESGTVELVYDYTAVPEPLSTTKYAGFSALGFVGLVTLRRKFSKAA